MDFGAEVNSGVRPKVSHRWTIPTAELRVYAMDGVYDENAGAIFVLTGILERPALALRAS